MHQPTSNRPGLRAQGGPGAGRLRLGAGGRWRERAEAAEAREAEAGADEAGAEAGGYAGRETVALHLYGFPFRP